MKNLLNDDESELVMYLYKEYNGARAEFSPAELKEAAAEIGLPEATARRFTWRENRSSWGKYSISSFFPTKEEKVKMESDDQESFNMSVVNFVKKESQHSVKNEGTNNISIIPEKDPGFVPWGFYKDIKKIIESKEFFPIFISGLSGVGKTIFVKQACAELKRPYIRLQITSETDETDLLGSWRLENGETVWVDGPVIVAAKTGSILLIDEIDRASSKIASLLGILEGQPILIKKTGEIVHPTKGFNIVATGNTKGRGSDSGKYTFAIILDDAILERFVINYNQSFPTERMIFKILSAHYIHAWKKELEPSVSEFIGFVSKWASIIYKTYENDGIDDIISIRRAVQILKIYSLFSNIEYALKMGVSRFDTIEQNAFFDLFGKVSNIEIKNTFNDTEE